MPTTSHAATGPTTPEGKRVAARNATTHGLFARDVVLPHLGEDPEGYKLLLDALTQQIHPTNLLEQHYVEKIAAASWRLRRLQRWQAQLFEDPDITEDEALGKLDRVMRHETTLHRQIDAAVRTLGRDLPQLFEGRARRYALAFAQVTERDCREDPEWDWQIAVNAQEQLAKLTAAPPLDPATLDARPAAPAPEAAPADGPNRQNEPATNHETLSFAPIAETRKERVASLGEPGDVSSGEVPAGPVLFSAHRCHKDLSQAIRPVTPREVMILPKRTVEPAPCLSRV